jgi:hypothetical protein
MKKAPATRRRIGAILKRAMEKAGQENRALA